MTASPPQAEEIDRELIGEALDSDEPKEQLIDLLLELESLLEQSAAAAKLQAVHRGRVGRQAARDRHAEVKHHMLPAGTRFVVQRRVQVRAGFALTSAKTTVLEVDDILDALESRPDPSGMMRVRCAHGWVSKMSAKGRVILVALPRVKDSGNGTIAVKQPETDVERELRLLVEGTGDKQLNGGAASGKQDAGVAVSGAQAAMLALGVDPASDERALPIPAEAAMQLLGMQASVDKAAVSALPASAKAAMQAVGMPPTLDEEAAAASGPSAKKAAAGARHEHVRQRATAPTVDKAAPETVFSPGRNSAGPLPTPDEAAAVAEVTPYEQALRAELSAMRLSALRKRAEVLWRAPLDLPRTCCDPDLGSVAPD